MPIYNFDMFFVPWEYGLLIFKLTFFVSLGRVLSCKKIKP